MSGQSNQSPNLPINPLGALQASLGVLAMQMSALGFVVGALMSTHSNKLALRKALDQIVTDVQFWAAFDPMMKGLPPEARKALEHYYTVLDQLIAKESQQDPE